MLKNLEKSKNNIEKKKLQVNLIKSGLNDLKNEIKEMFEDEKDTEQPNEIVDIVEKILEFNGRNRRREGLKLLTPDQILSRLSISLTQLKAGNNSEKPKNEIGQLLYSLYRSKKLNKTIYNNSVNTF